MKKNLFFITAFISLVATAQYDIVYNLEKGGVYPQNQVVTSEQDQVINGMPQEMTTIITTTSDYLVTDIKNGIYHIDVVVKSMSNETKSSMGSEVMSSDGPASNPMNVMFKNMIKDPIKITMDKYGKILSFDNSAQLEGLTEGMEMPELQLLQIEAAMKGEIDAAKQTTSYEQLTAILPKKPVKEGESWTQKTTINSIATFDTTSTYTLKSVTDDAYIITATANIKTPEGSTTDFSGFKAAYNLAGPSTATYTINRATGWIINATMEQNLDGDITVEKSEMMPQEMKMTMKTKTITIIE